MNGNNYKVHIGFGFHVNCYHSYRGDSPDELGFGGDIRIIRKIISILNDCNERGIPVKGTWDFENAYSLEEILPKYAPDIIDGVRERVKKNGDENIIMGYNNGALSAMTSDEFDASVEWAVTNKAGSGLEDIFGECEKIVRPQEVMFTPTQVKDYNRLGVKAVCLYYSCVSFDAFRSLVPPLRDSLAFNPVSFSYGGESMTVLPTYSNADVIDAGSLRYMAMDLHKKQLSGEINNDVFIFINMDADAILWEPIKLPFPLNKIANTQGIKGLAQEVADLPYVVYDTPGGYLKNHAPLCEISFGQDTADGSFSGYSSWAEKPFNRQIWTRLERARAYARARGCDAESPSFEDRVMLLSTTHFGLASPVLNVDRERRALALSEQMVAKELASATAERLTLLNPSGTALMSAQISFESGFLPSIGRLKIDSEDLADFGAVAMSEHPDGSVASAFVLCRFISPTKQVEIELSVMREEKAPQLVPELAAQSIRISLNDSGELTSLRCGNEEFADGDVLQSYITYNGKSYPFQNKRLSPLPCAGGISGCRVEGDIKLPEEEKPGRFAYDFFTLPGTDCIFVKTRLCYPYTAETHALSTQSSALGRKTDIRWLEAVPFGLKPKITGELHVVKRGFSHELSAYPVDSFRKSNPKNENLASFNHQLTAGFVGLTNGKIGLGLANARQLLCSMAHCPMRLEHQNGQDTVSLNPFGTYYGPQRNYPSRGNGAVGQAFVMVTPQSRSLAPAYNGAQESAVMALFAFEGLLPQGKAFDELLAFADGAVLLAPQASPARAPKPEEDNVSFPAITYDNTKEDELKSVVVSGVLPGKLQMAKIAVRSFWNIISHQIRASGRRALRK
ncbi:MAG: hypothetical protein LBQ80_02195 [Clostridium sp.]|jgi:hypothetical protein|nr:hypothetical protein [Clostridium sp.]